MQYIRVMIKREVLIKDTFRTSSANQESSSKKKSSSSDKGNKKNIKSVTSYQGILSNGPRKKKIVNTCVNQRQDKKSS